MSCHSDWISKRLDQKSRTILPKGELPIACLVGPQKVLPTNGWGVPFSRASERSIDGATDRPTADHRERCLIWIASKKERTARLHGGELVGWLTRRLDLT